MILATGFFDGVHRGHQAILSGADVALTFTRHPLEVLNSARAPALIMSLEERLAAIRACGVQQIELLDFTPALADESPAAFAARLRRLNVTAVRCGENWRFGQGGGGDADFLRAQGFPVTVVPYAVFDGARISSTRIRAALAAGHMEDAAAMLGRPCQVTGAVMPGKGLGGRLGFPTVNLKIHDRVCLPCGVYAVDVHGQKAIANYGYAPTLGARAWRERVFEVHFLEGVPTPAEQMTVAVLRFLRAERAFSSLQDLQAQIQKDIAAL